MQIVSNQIITYTASCKMLQTKTWHTMITILKRDYTKKISYQHQNLLQILLSVFFFLTFSLRKFKRTFWFLIKLVLLFSLYKFYVLSSFISFHSSLFYISLSLFNFFSFSLLYMIIIWAFNFSCMSLFSSQLYKIYV